MYFNGEYRKIGDVDVSALRDEIAALPEAAWDADSERQEVFTAHRTTQTIHLIFDPDMRHEPSTVHAMYRRFAPLLTPAMDAIEGFYARMAPARSEEAKDLQPFFARIILVRLAGGTMIQAHVDQGYSLSRAHRVHMPVVTNEKAVFGIAGNNRNLPAGEIWEVNNRKVHAVRNDGEARIHFIFDYVVPGEIVADPRGMLVA